MEYVARSNKSDKRKQSIKEHSENTARLCSEILKKINLGALGYIVGIIHDMGKTAPDFQDYILKESDALRGSVNHSAAGAEYIYNEFYLNEKDGLRCFTAQLIIDAVYAHHGRLFDCINPSGENIFQKKMNDNRDCGYKELAEIFFDEVISENDFKKIFANAVDEIKAVFPKLKPFGAFGLGMLQKLIYSALIDADRWDAFCFEANIDPFERRTADWNEAAEKMEKKAAGFIPDTPINEMRCKISNRCFEFAKRPGGIYRLSVPTGGGKTLSSLRYALQFAANNSGLVSHIFYVIPFRTILDQTAREVSSICGEENVLVHHSGIVVENEDDKKANERYGVLTQRWDSMLVLTTFVQFMNALYAGKSACARRMNALLNSVIIIDEVQSVPKKMISLFNEAINFLAEVCGATVLLCTATQPALDKLREHPIRLNKDCEIVPYNKKMLDVFKRTEVVDMTTKKGRTTEEIAELAEEIPEKSILIIANTTTEARTIYERLSGECHKIYLSTAKCRKHRVEELNEITRLVGAAEKSDEKLIVVSTQLVEAGVDLSFACVIRVMAGIDNLVQAAGRCNRHGEFGRLCKVYLVNIADENLSKLPDIAEAKQCTRLLLSVDKNRDLLDDRTVNEYYREYFKVSETELNPMNYIVGESSIMELLSDNKFYVREYIKRSKSRPELVMTQAFETAGREFRVIDSPTRTVLTTYGEGAEYIELLQSGAPILEKYKILKKCAEYTVNIFDYQINALNKNNGIYFIEDIGVYCLNEGFYNDEYGVITQSDLGFMSY